MFRCQQEQKKANDYKADMLISIHHNAGINGGRGGGTVVFRYPNSSKFTKTMQINLYNSLIKQTGLKGNRASPIAEANFQILGQAKMAAVLIENGFMDSKTDIKQIMTDDFSTKSARGLVDFLVLHFKLKHKGSKPIEKPKETPSKPASTLLKRGSRGSTVRQLQRDLLLLHYNIGRWGADGSFGNATEKAVKQFQRDHKLSIDGIAGKKTLSKIVQLKTRTTGREQITVDGYWGQETTKALQKYFSTVVDGKISKPSMVIRALQKHINAKPDGYLGQETIGKLQQHLGTPVDKKISKPSVMVKQLQRRLNAGNL